jgi:hypothetical protein
MIDVPTLQRLALALPEAEDTSAKGQLVFAVGKKGFAWSFMRRAAPRTPRRPDPRVLAVRCALERKEMLIDTAPEPFFTDDHYRGYPAVLVRLDAIDEEELALLLLEAWRLTAPKRLSRTRL